MTRCDNFVNRILYFKTFSILLIKYLVDTLDVMFDLYMFYQLEYGDIVNKNIYRNSHVNNAIYVFAFLGIIRIIRWRLYYNRAKYFRNRTFEHQMQVYMNLTMIFGFLIEDGPEMVLEYFFIEKYITESAVWYLLVRDVILGLLYCYSLFKTLKAGVTNCNVFKGGLCFSKKDIYFFRKSKRNNMQKISAGKVFAFYGQIYISAPMIGITQILRITGAALQYNTGEVNPKCFIIQDGKLLQTPFRSECMSWIDWTILVCACNVLSLSVIIMLAIPKTMFIDLIVIYRKYKEKKMIQQRIETFQNKAMRRKIYNMSLLYRLLIKSCPWIN